MIFFIIKLILFFFFLPTIKSEALKNEKSYWVPHEKNEKLRELIWTKSLDSEINFESIGNQYVDKNNFQLRTLGRGISFNGYLYPDHSSYVPNAFLADENYFLTVSTRGISSVRSCPYQKKNLNVGCNDAIADVYLPILKKDNYSFSFKQTIQSLSDRGSNFGSGQSLGFKFAKNYSKNKYFAIGADHLVHFDRTDLGRNFYLIFSSFKVLNEAKHPSLLTYSYGIGSDFYGYKGNGFLGESYCFGDQTLTGDGKPTCRWGPIGAVSFAYNEKVSLNAEWFGYGYGAGFSMVPFRDLPLSFSFFATDFLGNWPDYINEGEGSCFGNCDARFYGNITFSF